jgi:hypothetical protein
MRGEIVSKLVNLYEVQVGDIIIHDGLGYDCHHEVSEINRIFENTIELIDPEGVSWAGSAWDSVVISRA